MKKTEMKKMEIKNDLKHLSRTNDLLDWGYLKEIERIRESGLDQEVEDKKIQLLRQTHTKAVKDLKAEMSQLLDEFYKK